MDQNFDDAHSAIQRAQALCGYKQVELARAMGVEPAYLNSILRGIMAQNNHKIAASSYPD